MDRIQILSPRFLHSFFNPKKFNFSPHFGNVQRKKPHGMQLTPNAYFSLAGGCAKQILSPPYLTFLLRNSFSNYESTYALIYFRFKLKGKSIDLKMFRFQEVGFL